jgi:gluconolactonase
MLSLLITLLAQLPTTDLLPTPDALVDLSTSNGVALVHGTWRAAPAQIVAVEHRAPGPDKKPSGASNRTHDIAPEAFARDFDDSAWPVIAPETLDQRRADGKLSFEWYRFRFTVPAQLGALDVAGATIVLELVVDDYSEVWVDGKLPTVLGARGGGLAGGWNATNRVVVARDAQPGQELSLAIFGANAPLSDPPGNFVWIRSATLDFYRPERLHAGVDVPLTIQKLDPALDAVVPPGARLERVATGFTFTEGPLWVPDEVNGSYLLFSDPNTNVIWRYAPADLSPLSVWRTKSGYTGLDIARYRQPGSNGLALDNEGRVTICEHGNRRVTRLEKNGTLTVLADRYQGKRLNSPNDLVYRSDGALYFTDPPFGLPGFHADPARELDVTGVFCLVNGELKLVSTDLTGPNGLAFSPDERFLYVTNWDEQKKVVMRYEPRPDGTLANGQVFFDMGAAPEAEALDGIKLDRNGNLFVSGPGGLWVIASTGKHLGTLVAPEPPANLAWGAGGVLWLTGRTGLYRLELGASRE